MSGHGAREKLGFFIGHIVKTQLNLEAKES